MGKVSVGRKGAKQSKEKFRAVASIDSARERLALQRHLDSLEKADEESQANIDHLLCRLHSRSSSSTRNPKQASC
jgi:hypothetical protein